MTHTYVFPKNTINDLKLMFPSDTDLSKALDENSPKAWEIVLEKSIEIEKHFLALSKAGFPKKD